MEVRFIYLIRPTDNNQRYGLDELAQDEDDYEHQLELGRMHQEHLSQRKAAEGEGDIFDLDLNEGFEEDEDDEDVLEWAENLQEEQEREQENSASKLS